MRVLVTGGAGFIGSHLVEGLLAQGDEPVVLDNLATGRRSNLSSLDVELIEGDVRSREDVRAAVRGAEGVLHVAALPSVARSWQDPVASLAVNSQGTAIVLEEAIRAGVSRLVFSSSSSVYGDQAEMRKVESLEPRPISPYGFSKLLAEMLVVAHGQSGRIGTVALRYFNVFGSRQDPDSPYSAVIPRFIRAALALRTATIYGDGRQSRDFTYVDNVVAGNLLALRSSVTGLAINLAAGENRSLLDLIDSIEVVSGQRLTVTHEEARTGDIRHSLADISLAETALGYRPQVDFQEGLRRTFQSYGG